MNSAKFFLGFAFVICLLAFVGVVGAWVFGYAHGNGAGWATFALFLLTVGLGNSVFGSGEFKGKEEELPDND